MQSALEQRDQPQDPGSTDDAYTDYLEKLKQTFQDSQDGRLIEAGQGLLELSEWLSSHASDFGEYSCQMTIWALFTKNSRVDERRPRAPWTAYQALERLQHMLASCTTETEGYNAGDD